MNENHANPGEPVRHDPPETGPNPDLLTVSQAYDYLIAEGLPRSKKTIRKWCRQNHVEWKEIAVPGGAKWLITRSSLDARIAEERLIDASLTHETGTDQHELQRTGTDAHPSAPVRDDALVELLREQLAHEREARTAAETKNRELIGMYHEISLASARMGAEIGKGMQEQAKVRRLAVRNETEGGRYIKLSTGAGAPNELSGNESHMGEPEDPADAQSHGDNPRTDSEDDQL
jgi:hypothetical protein